MIIDVYVSTLLYQYVQVVISNYKRNTKYLVVLRKIIIYKRRYKQAKIESPLTKSSVALIGKQ